MSVVDDLAVRIRREGPVPFSVFMNSALYGPHGFYTTGGGAGRRRDFVTSPEVGELFGRVFARALDSWWVGLGRPDPFVVVECGAGPGALAASILRSKPQCLAALRYVLVEVSPAMQELQRRRRLPFVDAAQLLGESFVAEVEASIVPRQGPLVAQMTTLPADGVHVVFANELLDNIPFDLFERTNGRWSEVRIGLDADTATPAETLVAAADDHPIALLCPESEGSGRVPWMANAAAWVREAHATLEPGGRVVMIDYARPTTQEFLGVEGWLRTYREQQRAAEPLSSPGLCDITGDVAIDQLPRPTNVRTQADFLRAHGIDDVVTAAATQWAQAANPPSLADLAARSLTLESPQLLDLEGLGVFSVLEWSAR